MHSRHNFNTQSSPSLSLPQAIPFPLKQAQMWGLQSPTPLGPSQGQVYLGERDTDLINCPIYFPSGPFMGRTIRMELHEIQKADLGRKYARVDRRPLDPPPVVQLKLFEAHHSGTDKGQEKEIEYELSIICISTLHDLFVDFQVLGLICTVDLFPVPVPESLTVHNNPDRASRQTIFLSSPSLSSSLYHGELEHHRLIQQTPGYNWDARMSSGSVPSSFDRINHDPLSEIIHHVDGYPITEESKKTEALAGATFVQPVVMDYQGRKAIVFVFSDLAVKTEGHFILRYRAFDILARPYIDSDDSAISAVCYGGIFRVYSTKEFPGLSVSTELSRNLARWGVQLNIRTTDRRWKKSRKTSLALEKENRSSTTVSDDE